MVDQNKIDGLVRRALAVLAAGVGEEEFLDEMLFLVQGLSDVECRALLAALVRAGARVPLLTN